MLLSAPLLALSLWAVAPQLDADDPLTTFTSRLDDAEPALLVSIAAEPSLERLEALLASYDKLVTVFMRREVLRVLPRFDGEARGPAVTHLVEVVRAAHSKTLNEVALDALFDCGDPGLDALREIVGARTFGDRVREAAMDRVVRAARPGDHHWFLETYLSHADLERRRGEVDGRPPKLARVRSLAFEAVRSSLGELELTDACRDPNREIRRAALLELELQGSNRTVPIALDFLHAPREHPFVQAMAAGVLWRADPGGMVREFVKRGSDHVTPLALRYTLADLLAQAPSKNTERKLLPLLRRGKDFQKLFAMRALAESGSEKVDRELRKAVEDESPVVAFAAIELLAQHGKRGALPALEAVLEKGKDEALASFALVALSDLIEDPEERRKKLLSRLADKRVAVRSKALELLAAEGRSEDWRVIAPALDDASWSVRLSALHALEKLRVPESIGPVIERMGSEEGRLRIDFGESLWRVTGEPYGQRAELWSRWWQDTKGVVRVVAVEDLPRLERERTDRRLRQRSLDASAVAEESPAAVFELSIDSESVAFLIDVSVSMELEMRDEYEGQRELTRFAVARAELAKCIERLAPGSSFTVLAFSAQLIPWKSGELQLLTEESAASAQRFVEELSMGFGTDPWPALEAALAKDGLDTVFVISDGEPSGGKIDDPVHIRLEARRHNMGRGVRINAIAMGDDISLLRWLAEDSGGRYVRLR